MGLRRYSSYLRATLGILQGSRVYGGPVQVLLNLTNRCNIRCVHCYFYSPLVERPNLASVRRARQTGEPLPDHEELRKIQRRDMDSQLLISLLDQLVAMGTWRFQFGGTGEPFLHKQMLECAARLKHAGCYCFSNTNGTLLDRTTAAELIRLEFDELRITTMAGTQEVFERTHPGVSPSKFSSLKDNLLYLAQHKQHLGTPCPKVILITIVTTQNADNIIEFAEFAAAVGADGVLFRPVDDVGDEQLTRIVPSAEQAVALGEQLREVQPFLESRGMSHNIQYFQKVFGTQLDTTALYQLIPCYYGWLAANIYPEGDVFPCCRCYKVLGNINEQSFPTIWEGEPYRRFRREALQLARQRTPVAGCDCYSCVHYTANLRVYKTLNPIGGRSPRLRNLSPPPHRVPLALTTK